MGMPLGTKKSKLRSRAAKRRFALKPNPETHGVKTSIEKENLEVIRTLDSKIKAIQAEQKGQG
jgi:hypothetical protein